MYRKSAMFDIFGSPTLSQEIDRTSFPILQLLARKRFNLLPQMESFVAAYQVGAENFVIETN